MKKILVMVAILFVMYAPQAVAEETTIKIGVRTEAGTTFPYTANYIDLQREVEGQPLQVRIESWSRNVNFLFLNYGALKVVDEQEFRLTAFPGFIVTDNGKYCLGGNLLVEVPAAKLSVFMQEGAGNKGHRRLWLTNLKVNEWLSLRHSHFAHTGAASTHFLGPAVEGEIMGAKVWLWVGPCLNQKGGWSIDARASWKFEL